MIYINDIGNIGIAENIIKFQNKVCKKASIPYSILGLNRPPPVLEPKKKAYIPVRKYIIQQIIDMINNIFLKLILLNLFLNCSFFVVLTFL